MDDLDEFFNSLFDEVGIIRRVDVPVVDLDAIDYEIIRTPIKYSAFDRRQTEFRELEDRRDTLAATPEPTELQRKHLMILDARVKEARHRLDLEIKRDGDDQWRKLRNIDEWRSGKGREVYNTSRRKVRVKPNERLSDLSPEQKEQRKKDQRADANFKKSRAAKGWTDKQIRDGLEKREQKRRLLRQSDL